MVNTLKKQAEKYSQINSKSKNSIFGTDGIRGKVGDLLTPSLALKIGFATGKVWIEEIEESKGKIAPVIIGQDSRNSSDMLAMALASGLTAAGVEVWQLGLCPTPCVAYLTGLTEAMGGIMISASHNPPEDNGIKFFGNQGIKISRLTASKIAGKLEEEYDLKSEWGKHYNRPLLVEEYQRGLVRSLPKAMDFQGMRIVLDLAWGAAVNIAPEVFRELGAEVICLHPEADGDRINVKCGSTHVESLQGAIKEYQADLGFAFDGDADRVIAVDNIGKVVNGDYILYLWGKKLKEAKKLPKNLIVATVMANLGFEQAWRKLGGKLMRTAVGDQHVQEEMWHTGAMLGGEQSGHILCHHHSVSGDGLQTALHITSLVRQTGLSLADLVNESFENYPQILQNVRVEDPQRRLHWQECTQVQKAIALSKEAMGEEGRILVRASGTEPVIRVMVEAAKAEVADYWSKYLVEKVKKYIAI